MVIAVGDELLAGKTVNNNASFISARLSGRGVPTRRQIVVGDADDEIRAAFAAARELAPLAICTGGLGPTADDLTLPALAGYLGLELVLHQPTLQHVEAMFARRRIPMPAINIGQARVPVGSRVLRNPLGTAPGVIVEAEGWTACLLPGVPVEMEYLLDAEVIPFLEEKGYAGERRFEWELHTTGMGESAVAEKIGALAVPAGLHLAYLPQPGQVNLRIWGTGADEEAFREAARPLAEGIRAALGRCVFGEGGVTLEAAVGLSLAARRETLAVAESCTGGLVAKRITDVPGASAWFRGGVVAYANDAKMKLLNVSPRTLAAHGAVSEETAREMATGARKLLAADYGAAVTGVAGPAGGTEEKPVGTVCFAFASASKVETARQFFSGDRGGVRHRASQFLLDIIRLGLG